MAKNNRFSALRELREKRQEDNVQETFNQNSAQTVKLNIASETVATETEAKSKEATDTLVPKNQNKSTNSTTQNQKRGPGRPRGRRSNPNYTQISAYIPLELLLEVQDELAKERRERKQRTPRPVSDLMEELLDDWMKKRKGNKSAT